MSNCHGRSQLELASHLNRPEVMILPILVWTGNTRMSGGQVGIISSWIFFLILDPGFSGVFFGGSLKRGKNSFIPLGTGQVSMLLGKWQRSENGNDYDKGYLIQDLHTIVT